jgi:hypothetical protein
LDIIVALKDLQIAYRFAEIGKKRRFSGNEWKTITIFPGEVIIRLR